MANKNVLQPVNQTATAGAIVSASQFHTVAWVDVQLSPNPKDKDVYRQGSVKVGDQYMDAFALTGVALAKLMNAAGIKEIHSHRTDNGEHPYIVSWQFKGKWVQPDSTEIEYSADYTSDLRDWIVLPDGSRVRGPRFEKAYNEDRDSLVKRKHPTVEWKKLYGEAGEKKVIELLASMPQDEREEIEATAEALALRRIVQSRLFITQLAQTGAMDRVVRKFLQLKPVYTTEELSAPFSVPRSRFDWDRMDSVLGKDQAGQLKMVQAMKLLGIDAGQLAALKQLSAPAPQAEPQVGVIVEPEHVQEVTSITQATPGPMLQDDPGMPEEPPPPEEETKQVVKELGGQVSATFRDTQRGMIQYREWSDGRTQVQVFNQFRDAQAQVGQLQPGEKAVVAAAFTDKKTEKVNTFEMTNHLKKHFKKQTISALTWEELKALLLHKQDGKSDVRWYAEDAPVDVPYGKYGISTPTGEAAKFILAAERLKPTNCVLDTMHKHHLTWEHNHEILVSMVEVLADGKVEYGSDEFEALLLASLPEVPF